MRTTRSSRRRALAAVISASAAGLAGGALADDTTPPAEEPKKAEPSALEEAAEDLALEDEARGHLLASEIVVSAESGGVPLRYPGGRDVIGADTLARYADGNVATPLRRVPGVVILPESGNDSRLNIGLRGNDPRRSGLTTVLIDGIPACEAPYGNTDIDGLPVTYERIERIDVIRGGGSVRWGPNSAGGVVNFITRGIPEKPSGTFSARYGSNAAYTAAMEGGGTWDRFGAMASAVQKGGDGFRDHSEYEDRDGVVKLRYAFSDHDTASLSASRFTELDAEQPGGLTQDAYDEDPDQSLRDGYTNFRIATNTYRGEWTHDSGEGQVLQVFGWWTDGFRELEDARPIVGPYTTRRIQESGFSHGAVEARYSWSLPILGMKHEFFTSGRYLVERNREDYYSSPFGEPVNVPHDLDAIFTANAASFFGEDVIHLLDELQFAGGARVESIHMESVSRDPSLPVVERSEHYSEVLPEASLTWTPLERVALFGSWQENFLTPQYETGFDPTSSFYRPVDPEHSDTREVGARVRAVRGLEVTASYFLTNYEDKLDFVNLPNGTKIAVNTGRANARGTELGASYDLGEHVPDLKGLSVYATLTEQRTRIDTGEFEGNHLPHAPERLASWGVQYQHSSGIWGRIGGSYTGDQYKEAENIEEGSDDGTQGPEPSYTLWDAALGWRESPDGTGFAVQVGVTNLFEEEYFRRFSSGIYPGAPREVFVGVSYTLEW